MDSVVQPRRGGFVKIPWPSGVHSRHLLGPIGYLLLADCALLRAVVWVLWRSETSERCGVAWAASQLHCIESDLNVTACRFINYRTPNWQPPRKILICPQCSFDLTWEDGGPGGRQRVWFCENCKSYKTWIPPTWFRVEK
jgi:hypothetical protein